MKTTARTRREPPPIERTLATPGVGMRVTRTMRIGLGIVGIGWGVQVAGAPLGGASASLSVTGLAQSLILTGFGLAILAALHNGFGALNRFFETIAQRSAAAAAKAPPPPPPPAPIITVPERSDPDRLKGRGRIGERPYLQFADGSVEVETLLGSRRFESLEEARAFIGG